MTYSTIGDAVTMPGGAEGTLLAGRYRIVRQLGQGGMGSVWLAEDTQLDNKQFAVKMLPSVLVSNKRAYRQLKDEALVAMKLVHPNIVQLRAFEENNGNPFLVMDYIDGETLDDYLAEKGKLAEDDVLRVLRPIAAALDYAHSKGVVHRDVKPGNVMIAKDGTPYILDFGIAREIQETMTRVTGKLSSGTLLYMSPEQLRGQSPKPAQDIYSFAAMAYECLKGEPPFSRGQIEFQILNEQPESLEGHGRRGMTIASSVMSGLAKKPEDRPPTCAAVLEGNVSRGGAETQRVVSNGNGRREHVERVEGHTPSPLRGTSPVSGEESVGSNSPSKIEGHPPSEASAVGGSMRGVAAGRESMIGKIAVAVAVPVLAAAAGWWWVKYDEGVKVREVALMKVEAERKAAEAEAKRQAEEEARKAEEARLAAEKAEAERKVWEEAEAKRQAEEEARKTEAARLAAEKAEAERKAREEAEAKRKAAEEAKRKAKEAEAKRMAAEEAKRKAEEARKAEAARLAAEKKAESDKVKSSAVNGLLAKLDNSDVRTRFLKFVDDRADGFVKTNLNDTVNRILSAKSLSAEDRWLASVELAKFSRQFFGKKLMEDARAMKTDLNGDVHNATADRAKVIAKDRKASFNDFFGKLERFVAADPKDPSTVVLLAELIDITPGHLDLK